MPKKKTEEESSSAEATADKPSEALAKDAPEQRNVYNYQTSSTTEGLMSPDDFWKVKLSV